MNSKGGKSMIIQIVITLSIPSILSALQVGYYALGILVAFKKLQTYAKEKSHDQKNSHDPIQK